MHHRRGRRALFVAVSALLLTATPALAGEITDENEAVEKIVIRVNDDPERDPEQSVGGETITIFEGDEVTFRIAINEDQTAPNRDNVAEVKDVFKTNRFDFVSFEVEFGGTCDPAPPADEDTSITCMVNLDPVDGNAALRIRLRALDIGGEATDPNGCVKTTNVVSTVEPSGGDQAQVEICPAVAEPASVLVMKHLCNEDIANADDFRAVEEAGGGRGTLGGLVATVLACPTIVLPGDDPTPGAVTGGRVAFNFTEVDAGNAVRDLGDTTFMQAALCEDDVNMDANGDGEISGDVCLDTSHYAFGDVTEGAVTVTETDAPDGARFGAVRFTPGSGDAKTLVSDEGGVIVLDTTADDETTGEGAGAPNVVVLHVYNFRAAAPVVDQLPDAATEPAATGGPAFPLAVLALIGLVALVRVRLAPGRANRG